MLDISPRYSTNKVLVIDDIASMRSQIVSNLTSMGFKDVWSVASCQKALAHVAHIDFDLILCDYHLGEVTSGQQFLEHLRMRDLIPTSTLFVMVTARRAYEEVMRAAEFAPDDYLVKPFTGAQLNARLSKLFERRNRFTAVHTALDKEDWSLAITLCDNVIQAQDRFAMEAIKLKGHGLLKAKRIPEAEALYRSVLNIRSLGWAKLGLAKALKAQNALSAAETVLNELLTDSKQYSASDRMNAFDELTDVLQAADRQAEALAVMQKAMSLSSGSLARARKMTALAVDQGNIELAEKTVRKLVADQKHSQIKDSGDYLMAAEVLSTAGFPDDALSTVHDVRKVFDDPRDIQTLTVAEVTAHVTKGDNSVATQLLKSVSLDGATDLPVATAAALGKNLFRIGDDESAAKVLKQLIQNNPDNKDIVRTVHSAMAAVGKQEESKALVDSSLDEVAKINDDGVRLAYAGKLDEAVALLSKAAELLPGNIQFVSNAALVMALALTKSENIDRNQYETCLKYRKIVAAREPNHPKLAQIDGLLKILEVANNDVASRRA